MPTHVKRFFEQGGRDTLLREDVEASAGERRKFDFEALRDDQWELLCDEYGGDAYRTYRAAGGAGGAGVGWEAYTGVKVTVPDSGEGEVLYSPAACVACTLKKDDDDSNEAKNYETASIFFRKVGS